MQQDPIAGLSLGVRPDPVPEEGWTVVQVKATSLNHHDLWSLKGVGLREDQLPMVLGTDAAGIDEDGNEVVIHAVIGDPARGGGDETLDPKRSLLSEVYNGTLAELVAVPRRNLVPKPAVAEFRAGVVSSDSVAHCLSHVGDSRRTAVWRDDPDSGCGRWRLHRSHPDRQGAWPSRVGDGPRRG